VLSSGISRYRWNNLSICVTSTVSTSIANPWNNHWDLVNKKYISGGKWIPFYRGNFHNISNEWCMGIVLFLEFNGGIKLLIMIVCWIYMALELSMSNSYTKMYLLRIHHMILCVNIYLSDRKIDLSWNCNVRLCCSGRCNSILILAFARYLVYGIWTWYVAK